MIAYIVCEGPADTALLRRVLPQELLDDVYFVEAGGRYSIKSMAHSLLVERQTPVAIVVDAHSVAPDVVQEQRQGMGEFLQYLAGNIPTEVVLAVPELEALFFQDIALLERVFGTPIPGYLLAFAGTSPVEVLKQLDGQPNQARSYERILAAITPQDVEVLQRSPVVQQLSEFLRRARAFSLERAQVPGKVGA